MAEDVACGDAVEADCIMKWKDALRKTDLPVPPKGVDPK